MHWNGILLCFTTVLISYSFALETIPDFIHICHKNDPKVLECMVDSIVYLRPYLAKGIPEMDVPSIEPLELGDLLVAESSVSNGLRVTAKDIKTFGPSNFGIQKLHITEFGKIFDFEITLPNLYVTGIYNINGQILLLPIKGSGKFTGNFTNSVGKTKCMLGTKEINGEEYVYMKKIEIKIKVGNGSLKLSNLFNGDKILGDAINDVINQNFEVLSDDLIPLIEKALQRTFKKVANKIVNRYTFDQLFPN